VTIIEVFIANKIIIMVISYIFKFKEVINISFIIDIGFDFEAKIIIIIIIIIIKMVDTVIIIVTTMVVNIIVNITSKDNYQLKFTII